MITLQEKVCVNVSFQDSLIKLAEMITSQEKVCVNVSYQDSLTTAGKNDYFIRKGVYKYQLSRQPNDSWQK
jgi:hypothetical protein